MGWVVVKIEYEGDVLPEHVGQAVAPLLRLRLSDMVKTQGHGTDEVHLKSVSLVDKED